MGFLYSHHLKDTITKVIKNCCRNPGFAMMSIHYNLHTCACHCHFINWDTGICAGEKASEVWIYFVIPGGRWFWSLLIYLEKAFALNLEFPDCWPMLSKFAWFQKGNTAFCSSRQHPSSSINQSALEHLLSLTLMATSQFPLFWLLGGKKSTLWKGNDRERLSLVVQYWFGGSRDTVGFLQSRAVSLSCWDPE